MGGGKAWHRLPVAVIGMIHPGQGIATQPEFRKGTGAGAMTWGGLGSLLRVRAIQDGITQGEATLRRVKRDQGKGDQRLGRQRWFCSMTNYLISSLRPWLHLLSWFLYHYHAPTPQKVFYKTLFVRKVSVEVPNRDSRNTWLQSVPGVLLSLPLPPILPFAPFSQGKP